LNIELKLYELQLEFLIKFIKSSYSHLKCSADGCDMVNYTALGWRFTEQLKSVKTIQNSKDESDEGVSDMNSIIMKDSQVSSQHLHVVRLNE